MMEWMEVIWCYDEHARKRKKYQKHRIHEKLYTYDRKWIPLPLLSFIVIVVVATIITLLLSSPITIVVGLNSSNSTSHDYHYQARPIPDPNDSTHIKAHQLSTENRCISSDATKVMLILYVIMYAIIQALQRPIITTLITDQYCIHLTVLILILLTFVLDTYKNTATHTLVIFQIQVNFGMKDTI